MRIKGILLQVLVAVLIAAGMRVTANADTIKGKCGANCRYSYNTDTKEMVISGTGDITDKPWVKASYFHEIKKVTIKNGITALKVKNAFTIKKYYENPEDEDDCGYVYTGCKGLKTVHMAKSVKEVAARAFYQCGNLKTLTIPGVEIIHKYAFCGCIKLSGVKFSKSIRHIGPAAFWGNDFKGELVIKKGVYYGSDAFGGAKSLKKVTYEEGIKYIKGIVCGNNLESVKLPKSAVTIGEFAFGHWGKIKTITIPSNVKKIEYSAFNDSPNLKKIVIKSKKITAINNCAFDWLKNNTDIYVPKEKYSEYKKLIRNSVYSKNTLKKIRIIKY